MKIFMPLIVMVFLGVCALTSNQIGFLGSTAIGIAHSGGTDECGCHKNSKTGEYHCHTRKKRGGNCPPSSKVELDEPREEEKDRARENDTKMA